MGLSKLMEGCSNLISLELNFSGASKITGLSFKKILSSSIKILRIGNRTVPLDLKETDIPAETSLESLCTFGITFSRSTLSLILKQSSKLKALHFSPHETEIGAFEFADVEQQVEHLQLKLKNTLQLSWVQMLLSKIAEQQILRSLKVLALKGPILAIDHRYVDVEKKVAELRLKHKDLQIELIRSK